MPALLISKMTKGLSAGGSGGPVPASRNPAAALKSIGVIGMSVNRESEIRNRNIFISFEAIYISCHCWSLLVHENNFAKVFTV